MGDPCLNPKAFGRLALQQRRRSGSPAISAPQRGLETSLRNQARTLMARGDVDGATARFKELRVLSDTRGG